MTDPKKENDSTETIDIEEIIKLLPHRYPFLLVDRVLEVTPGESIVALKNVTINEPFFQGHFPTRPVMPGVLILEGMAQAGCLLAYISLGDEAKGKLIYFAGMDGVKFRQPVVPGDQIIFKLNVLKLKSKVWKMAGKAFVEDMLVAEATLTAVIR